MFLRAERALECGALTPLLLHSARIPSLSAKKSLDFFCAATHNRRAACK
jgi:hypothetical protein